MTCYAFSLQTLRGAQPFRADCGFDKTIVITDGYASMSREFKQQLKKHGLVALTILFDDAQTCEDFAVFGEVVLLGDVTQ